MLLLQKEKERERERERVRERERERVGEEGPKTQQGAWHHTVQPTN